MQKFRSKVGNQPTLLILIGLGVGAGLAMAIGWYGWKTLDSKSPQPKKH
jgi:hypothetical protein